ncbi:CoA pyrophosphatase [Nisaea sp.]|uniref:CoA pyrophosphatase n=1 Tax=Nisaea sp. TaxID=2024842 RepID=UPI0032676327
MHNFDSSRLRSAFREGRPDDTAEGRGDHDLNPDMKPPVKNRPASVLIPIIERDEGLTMLLTKRSEDLPVHPGQISFPGGRAEPHDDGPVDTALRETEEEVGIHRRHIDVVGQLGLYSTRTGFEITPVVGLLTPPFDTRADPMEVQEIFEVPLAFFLDRENHERHSREWNKQIRSFYAMPYGDYYIWGATAGMLVNFVDVLLPRFDA